MGLKDYKRNFALLVLPSDNRIWNMLPVLTQLSRNKSPVSKTFRYPLKKWQKPNGTREFLSDVVHTEGPGTASSSWLNKNVEKRLSSLSMTSFEQLCQDSLNLPVKSTVCHPQPVKSYLHLELLQKEEDLRLSSTDCCLPTQTFRWERQMYSSCKGTLITFLVLRQHFVICKINKKHTKHLMLDWRTLWCKPITILSTRLFNKRCAKNHQKLTFVSYI